MEIIALPVGIDHPKVDSRYRLVNIAAHRARQLMEGAKIITPSQYTKASSIALIEVLGEGLEVLSGKDACAAQREEKHAREEARTRAMVTDRDQELAAEIQKKLNIYLASSTTKTDAPDPTEKEAPEE